MRKIIMNDDIRSADTAPEDDAWLESLLRNGAAKQPYLDDNGFTERLMAALPSPRKKRNRGWIVCVMALFGMLIGGIGLHGMETSLQDLLRLAGGQAIPFNHLASLLILIGVFYWLTLDMALE